MQIASQIKTYVESVPPGKIITYQDLSALQGAKPQALAKTLERLVKKKILVRQSKGAFYRPKDTIFGPVAPHDEEIISFLTRKGNRITGILTGQSLYLNFKISTQVPSVLTIASITPKKKRIIGNLKVQFVRSYVSTISEEDIPLLQILEAFRFIKKAQECTPESILNKLRSMMQSLSNTDLQKLADLARAYPPMVRALCGYILEDLGNTEFSNNLFQTINPFTKYKIGLPQNYSAYSKWGIL